MALYAKGKYDQAEMVKNILPSGVEFIFSVNQNSLVMPSFARSV
jgi:hypothetical protein